jgi:hypothetical protein
MNRNGHLFLVVSLVLDFVFLTAQAADSVRGQVVDENGKPLDGVTWTVSAIEELHDGKRKLIMHSGKPEKGTTDSEGLFTVPFHKPQRYDLQLHKSGFAPAFLFEVSVGSPQIKVTLKRGQSIHGTVRRWVNGKPRPAEKETVVLCLPGRGLWYEEKVLTDSKGRFEFRACAAPVEPSGQKWTWQVVYLNQTVELDVQDGRPVDEVNFESS